MLLNFHFLSKSQGQLFFIEELYDVFRRTTVFNLDVSYSSSQMLISNF